MSRSISGSLRDDDNRGGEAGCFALQVGFPGEGPKRIGRLATRQ